MSRSNGFTIVELIVSLVLLGLISATVYSRWFNTDTFRISAAGSQFVSTSRLAQRIALAKSNVEIHLIIDQSGGDWQYLINEDDGGTVTTLHQINLDASDINIQATAGIGPTSLSAATILDLEFDALGNIIDVFIGASQGSVADGVLIQLSGSVSQSVCISPLGFSHDGACV